MEIVNITEENKYFQEIVDIYYNWWGFKKNQNYQEFYKKYLDYLNSEDIPKLYALINNNTLIGMYEINEKDYIFEKEYSPYLANVYVKKEFRGYKYSTILIKDALQQAASLGYKRLYLHTKHENYYEKYGFKFLLEVATKYGVKRIFVKDI